jgi:3-hydroxyisobutyrate dehydrogenase
MNRIAFLGLGAMGTRMATRLITAGHELTVWNRTPSAAQGLVSLGAHQADTPGEAVRGAEMVISMVRDDEASRAVWLDPEDGALAAARVNTVIVESSTLTPAWVAEWAHAARALKVQPIDAPVVGSRPQAMAGQLVVLAGGDTGAIAHITPVLQAYAAAIHHVGPTGCGATLKLAVNALFATQVAALAELFGWLNREGINPANTLEVLRSLPLTSPAAAAAAGSIVTQQFAPLFPVELVEKDLSYALSAAHTAGAILPTIERVRELYVRAREGGHGGAHITAVSQIFG